MVTANNAVPVEELGCEVEVSAGAAAGVVVIDDVAARRGQRGS
jgi:hypothetical protein